MYALFIFGRRDFSRFKIKYYFHVKLSPFGHYSLDLPGPPVHLQFFSPQYSTIPNHCYYTHMLIPITLFLPFSFDLRISRYYYYYYYYYYYSLLSFIVSSLFSFSCFSCETGWTTYTNGKSEVYTQDCG